MSLVRSRYRHLRRRRRRRRRRRLPTSYRHTDAQTHKEHNNFETAIRAMADCFEVQGGGLPKRNSKGVLSRLWVYRLRRAAVDSRAGCDVKLYRDFKITVEKERGCIVR